MYRSTIFAVLVVASAFQCRANQISSVGLCSQLQQMHQLCIGHCGDTSQVSPTTLPGPRGPPGEVNYDVIDSKIADMFAEYKARTDAKIHTLETELADLQNSLVHDCPTSEEEHSEGNLFTIYPGVQKTVVYCDLETDGGGWTVFQRRIDGSVDFYRNWNDYVNGFGDKTGEFWLGLGILHKLTSERSMQLRIDLEDWDGNIRHAAYSTFQIGDALSSYRINVGGFVGNAGDSFSSANGMRFSTKDRDSDIWNNNCAVSYKGAWWYTNCHKSNLNGLYFKGGVHKSYADGIEWTSWKGVYYSMKFTEMKIRPIA